MLAETSRILPWLPLWPWLWVGAPGLLPVGAGGQSRLCLPQEASQAAAAAPGPCPGLGDGLFPCVSQLGPFIIGKKADDQAGRLENKDLKRKGLGCSRPVEALVRQQVFVPFVRRLDF